MDAVQFEIIVTLLTFIFFFTVGYFSDSKSDDGKIIKSSGFILMFSGFVFLYLEYILIDNNIMNIYYVVSLMSVFGLYFIILGIYKAFWSN